MSSPRACACTVKHVRKLMSAGFKHLTFFEVSLFYTYAGIVLTRVLETHEIVKSLLALPAFFLVPFLVGLVLVELAKLALKNRIQTAIVVGGTTYLILCLLTGVFSIEFIAVGFQMLNLSLLLRNIGYLFLAIATFGFYYFRLSRNKIILGERLNAPIKKHMVPLLFIVGFNIVPFLIKISLVQFPLTPWDAWANPIAHVQAVLRLLNNGFFDITQRWIEILFTAISCQLFNISHPEFFSYAGTLLVTTMLSLGTFALVYRLSSSAPISLLCGVLSIFLNAPIGTHETPAYQFKSNSILIGLSPWILLLVIDLLNKQKTHKLKSVLTLTIPVALSILGLAFLSGATTTHKLYSYGISYETQYAIIRPIIIMAIPLIALMTNIFFKGRMQNVSILLLASTVLYTTNEYDSLLHISVILLFILVFYVLTTAKKGHISLRTASLLILIIVFLAWNNVITLPDISISAFVGVQQPFTENSFLIKKIVFSDGNSLITRYFFILGLTVLMFSRKRGDLLALGALTAAFFLYFFPEPWTVRALGTTTSLMAFAISKNLDLISKMVSSIFAPLNRTKIVATCILASLFVVVITPSLLSPLYMKFSRFPGSRLAPYEYDVAHWLRHNTGETEVILSDYWTMMLLNPVANKIWLTSRQFMYEPLGPESKHLLAELKNDVFNASSSWEAYNKIQSLTRNMQVGIDWAEEYYCKRAEIKPEDITFLIVLSSRTVKWLETDSMDIMEPQYSAVNSTYLAIFNDTEYFTPLTQVLGQLYVFKVRL